MKLYVDKLPKSCEDCPMCRSGNLKLKKNGRYIEVKECVFGQYKYQTIDDEIDTCPLQHLSDYTKQVRKEVCETIKSDLLDFSHSYWRVFKSNGKQYMTDDDLIECLNEILNQIQGE